ncbi:MAG: 16S rRNA (adenine(1518)-N(6)/adenine(1519)-N(6))-dimethyltransferase RsmA [Clostridia bacterium]|nr:16S rRNA (adenine(1518)-N(6)/adenine(1519)-N(6))-dimethyltransferase RsmA [Clostridia bacterium]
MENDLKSVLAECGFGFKKKFGQNFITDKNLLASIVAQSGVESGDTVIEIGCGAGTLTRAIAERAARVIAFEVDTSLKPVLERTLSGVENAEVIFKDFLKVNLTELEKQTGEYCVIANLPYYVTTPLITKLLEEGKRCKSLTVMVQEEVAQRLCAKENTPEYGAITAVIALTASAQIIKKVPRTMFTPRPNVDSAVVKLSVEHGRIDVKDEALYKKTVHAAFAARRKTLENNLINTFKLTREQTREILLSCDIDLKARGETLSPQKFALLSDKIGEAIK